MNLKYNFIALCIFYASLILAPPKTFSRTIFHAKNIQDAEQHYDLEPEKKPEYNPELNQWVFVRKIANSPTKIITTVSGVMLVGIATNSAGQIEYHLLP